MFRSMLHRALGENADVLEEPAAQGIFVAHAILVTGTVLLSPIIADLAQVFAVSEARAGLFIIIYTGTLMVVLPVTGVIADRIGRRTAVLGGLVVFGLSGAAIALVETFEAAIALRVIQAVGVAFGQPILVAMLGDLYSGARETTAQGIRVAIDSALSIVTPFLAGVLFVIAWQAPFLVYLTAIPVAVVLWWALPETAAGGGTGSLGAQLGDLAVFVRDRVVGVVLLSLFVRYVVLYGFYTYVSVLAVREVGVDVVVVGIALSVFSTLKLLSSTQAGRFADRTSPATVVLVGFALSGLGVFAMGILPTVAVLFGAVVVHGVGDGLISPTQKSLVNHLSAQEVRGSAMSLAFTVSNVGRSVGPLGLGVVLVVIGPAPTFALLGALGGGLGMATMVVVHRWRNGPAAE